MRQDLSQRRSLTIRKISKKTWKNTGYAITVALLDGICDVKKTIFNSMSILYIKTPIKSSVLTLQLWSIALERQFDLLNNIVRTFPS